MKTVTDIQKASTVILSHPPSHAHMTIDRLGERERDDNDDDVDDGDDDLTVRTDKCSDIVRK